MKLFIGSDYHLEILPPHLRNEYFFNECVSPEVRKNKDDLVFVMAGDLNSAADPKYIDIPFAFGDCVYTPGNHEYWGADMMHLDDSFSPDKVKVDLIDDVTFVSAPLFSDPEEHCSTLPDFSRIKYLGGPFTLQMHKALHKKNIEGMREVVQKHKKAVPTNKLVIVTHFLPLPQSIAPRWAGDKYTSYFHTDLTDLVAELDADLWVHGHTHDSFDYVAPNGKTRVICNPYGYPEHDHNPNYNPNLIVEI